MAKKVNLQGLSQEEQILLSQKSKAKHESSLKTRRIVSNILVYVILSVMVVVWILPILWIVLQSLNVEPGAAGLSRLFPQQWGFDNFKNIFTNHYTDEYGNQRDSAFIFFLRLTDEGQLYFGSFFYTLFIAIISALISTLFVLATSYAF